MRLKLSMSKRNVTLLAAGLMSTSALAHYPIVSCKSLAEHKMECFTGFSDGSLADLAQIKVFDYDDNLLSTYKTSNKGVVSFNKPKGEFYILFDAGHEEPAEFDYSELEP